MQTKNPYDVLGVSASASSGEIRAAYIRRTKVLHPDRFDSATQNTEWQMANEMLQELNEAYAELNAKAQEPARKNGHSDRAEMHIVICSNCGVKNNTPNPCRPANCGRCGTALPVVKIPRPATETTTGSNDRPASAETESFRIDAAASRVYWAEINRIYFTTLATARQITPLEVKQRPIIGGIYSQNFDQHLGGLNMYVKANFEAQLSLAQLDQSNVDPISLAAEKFLLEALLLYSRLFTDRIVLVVRAKYFYDKYPFWRSMWGGHIGSESKADLEEWNNLGPKADEIYANLNTLDTQFKIDYEVIASEWNAKYEYTGTSSSNSQAILKGWGFVFKGPPGWTVESVENEPIPWLYGPPNGRYRSNINFTIFPDRGSLEGFVARFRSDRPPSYCSNWRELSNHRFTTNEGRKGIRLITQFNDSRFDMDSRVTLYFFERADQQKIGICCTPQSIDGKLDSLYDQCVKAMTIN